MKKIIATFLFLTCVLVIDAQKLPTYFDFPNNRLQKTSDFTPTGNSSERIWVDGNTIWLGTGYGLSRSTDNGDSWTNYYKTDAFGEESVYAVKTNNGVVWAGKWHMEPGIGDDIPTGTGLCYSTDNGETWAKIDQPRDNITDTVITYGINKLKIAPIATASGNMVRDIGFTKNTIWIASWGGGLRKSTDNGSTWQRVVLPPNNLDSIKPTDSLDFVINPSISTNYYVFAIVVVEDTIYVGTAGGINKSTDDGISWTKFNHTNQERPITGNFIWSMSYNNYDHSIWAGTWNAQSQIENWGLSFTTDGGRNWQTNLYGQRVYDIAFKYFGNQGNYTGYDAIAATETGLYRSSNNGVTWIAAPQIVDANTRIALTTNEFRAVKVQKTDDGADNIWAGSSNGLVKLKETTGFWTGDWKIFLASSKIENSNETFAFPNPFSPDAEVVRIKYNVENGSNVTIRIFDFGMNLVRTVIQNASRGASDSQTEIWDGKDETGKIVPNGVYFYRIDIGSQAPLYGKIMVLM